MIAKHVRFDPTLPEDKPSALHLRKRNRSPPPSDSFKRQKLDEVESTDPYIIDFKKNFDFAIFALNFDREKTFP